MVPTNRSRTSIWNLYDRAVRGLSFLYALLTILERVQRCMVRVSPSPLSGGLPCLTWFFSRSEPHLSPGRCFTRWLATAFEETSMIVDYALGGAVTLGLLAFLIYALIRPERF